MTCPTVHICSTVQITIFCLRKLVADRGTAVCKKITKEMILELSGLFTFLALGFWGTRVDLGDFYSLITNK